MKRDLKAAGFVNSLAGSNNPTYPKAKPTQWTPVGTPPPEAKNLKEINTNMKELAKALKKKVVFGSASAGHNDANAATIKSFLLQLFAGIND